MKETVKYICYKIVEIFYKLESKIKFNGLVTQIIKWEIRRNYRYFMHKEVDLKNPKDLNEKINWLKLNDDQRLWGMLADKYKVRDYVAEKGLSDILVPLYGVWDSAKEIEWDKLPSSFVLKTNHGSGDIIKVTDKDKINKDEVIKKLDAFLRMPYGVASGEPHYLYIKPKVIAEELLTPKDDYSTSLVDYKIWCFNGEPQHVWACYSRTKNEVKVETYDLKWKHHPECSVFNSHYQDGGGIVPKPVNLEEMLDVARKLSAGIKQVRVDLYNQAGKIYFGEMTLTGNGGYMDFYTQEFLDEMGDCISLDIK